MERPPADRVARRRPVPAARRLAAPAVPGV